MPIDVCTIAADIHQTNRPTALASVCPWAGRLWREDASISLGASVFKTDQMTGSFGWRALSPGVTTSRTTQEPCYDDPYFILQNESNGEYFFGELAWPSTYMMQFVKTDGLSFRIGPIVPEGTGSKPTRSASPTA